MLSKVAKSDIIEPEKTILEQPVVFLGSEGEQAVVSKDFGDYVWLLAKGSGPAEVARGLVSASPNETFTAFAKKYAPSNEKEISEIIADAEAAFPDLKETIESLAR